MARFRLLPAALLVGLALAAGPAETTTPGPGASPSTLGPVGEFTYEAGQADGRFASLRLDPSTGTVSNLSLDRGGDDLALLRSATPEDLDPLGPPRASGPVLQHDGANLQVRVYDTATPVVAYRTDGDARVRFELGPDVVAESVHASGVVRLQGTGNFTGSLVVAGDGTASAGKGTATLAVEGGGAILLRAHPAEASPSRREDHEAIDHGLGRGQVGGLQWVGADGGSLVEETLDLGVHADAEEGVEGRLRVEAGAGGDGGRVLHVQVAPSLLPLASPDDAVAKVDGRRSPLAEAPRTVLEPGGDRPVHVAVGNGSVGLTARIPAPGLHTVLVKDGTLGLPDLPDPAPSPNPTGASVSKAEQAWDRAQARTASLEAIDADLRQQATDRALEVGLFWSADVQGNDIDGGFVDAEVRPARGTLSNLTVTRPAGNGTLLEEVSVGPADLARTTDPEGPTVTLAGPEAALEFHDTPAVDLQLKAGGDPTRVTYTFPPGASMREVQDHHLEVETPAGAADLLLVHGDGSLVVQGHRVTTNLGANASVLLRAEPATPSTLDLPLGDPLDALRQERVAAWASLAAAGDATMGSVTNVHADVRPAGATGTSLSTTVETGESATPIVILRVPAGDLGTSDASQVTVTVGGNPIPSLVSLPALRPGDGEAAFAAGSAGDVVEVAVRVPGDGRYTVTVAGPAGTAAGSSIPWASALAVAAATGAALVAGRRR